MNISTRRSWPSLTSMWTSSIPQGPCRWRGCPPRPVCQSPWRQSHSGWSGGRNGRRSCSILGQWDHGALHRADRFWRSQAHGQDHSLVPPLQNCNTDCRVGLGEIGPEDRNFKIKTWALGFLTGNWILNRICFLQFFDSSTPKASNRDLMAREFFHA